jgi:cytoskeletal protein CcmA (bactofilin family)
MSQDSREDSLCAFIGEGVTFKGSISAPEKVVLHGTVEGDLTARELFVGSAGTVKGKVHVEQAIVEGKVLENIEAKGCLSLRRTGQIEGNASYGEIEIEKGGILAGEVSSILHTELPTPLAPSGFLNIRPASSQPSTLSPIPSHSRAAPAAKAEAAGQKK